MSREQGTFKFAANFEGTKKAPIDARQLVDRLSDLTGNTTWNQSGNIWLYNGAIVSVGNDPEPSNNGLYFLKDANNYNDINSWIKLGSGEGTITGGTNGLSVDGRNLVLGGDLLNGTTIAIKNGAFLSFADDRTVKLGLQYANDYSSHFQDLSLVNKKYVDTVAAGLQPKMAVLVATTENIVLSGNSKIIDGISVTDGDRILVKNQSDKTLNGIYIVTGGTWFRSPDFDGSPEGEIAQGALIPVISGNTNSNTLWVLVTKDPIEVGTTDLVFTLFSKVTDFTYTQGIVRDDNTIKLDDNIYNHINLSVTGATNGLCGFTNNKIGLGGNLTENTTIYGNNKMLVLGNEGACISSFYVITSNLIYLKSNGTIQLTKYNTADLSFGSYSIDVCGCVSNFGGIKYVSDYSSSYTSRSLVDKEYVDKKICYCTSGITGTITGGTNGLGVDGNKNIKLGGVLCENTTISGDSYILRFGTLSSCLNGFYVESDSTQLQGSSIYINGLNNAALNGGNIRICLTNDCGLITDNRGIGYRYGLEYAADYSDDFKANSLVTKKYVDLNFIEVLSGCYTIPTRHDYFIAASGNTCIYLHSDPRIGQKVIVADVEGCALIKNINIYGNGKNILGAGCSVINTDYGSVTYIFNSRGFWSATAFIN